MLICQISLKVVKLFRQMMMNPKFFKDFFQSSDKEGKKISDKNEIFYPIQTLLAQSVVSRYPWCVKSNMNFCFLSSCRGVEKQLHTGITHNKYSKSLNWGPHPNWRHFRSPNQIFEFEAWAWIRTFWNALLGSTANYPDFRTANFNPSSSYHLKKSLFPSKSEFESSV